MNYSRGFRRLVLAGVALAEIVALGWAVWRWLAADYTDDGVAALGLPGIVMVIIPVAGAGFWGLGWWVQRGFRASAKS